MPEETHIAVIVRQQAWFRAHVEIENLSSFPAEQANSIPLNPQAILRARVLVGKGPLERDMPPENHLWFDHGEHPYPVLQCPSIGPSGAGLHARTTPSRLVVPEDQAVSLVEVSSVVPVDPQFPDRFNQEAEPVDNGSGVPVFGEAQEFVNKLLGELKRSLEQVVGLYALYQYPLVWEPLSVCPLVAFVNIQDKTMRNVTPIPVDNFVPFLLRVDEKITDGHLTDGGLVDFAGIADGTLHLPLALLQRSLWQRNVAIRFLETFWIIEHLVGRFSGEDAERCTRAQMYEAIRSLVAERHPEYSDRIERLKGVFVQPPLRHRLDRYLDHLGIQPDPDALARMFTLRNELSHGGGVDERTLAAVELGSRTLVRDMLQRELAAQGIRFGERTNGGDPTS